MKKGIPQRKNFLSAIRVLRPNFCFAICILWSTITIASPPEEPSIKGGEIEKIDKLFAQAEYAQARGLITQLLKQSSLTQKLRAQLYWQKAVCHISEDQISLARSSFLKLLATDPLFSPGRDTSPKILSLYQETYNQFKEQGGLEQTVKYSFIPVETAVAGEPIHFQVKINSSASLKQIERIQFRVRKLGNSEYSSLDFTKLNEPTLFEATIPPVLTLRVDDEATYEYYIDFFTSSGARLGGIGKNVLPLTFIVNGKAQDTNSKIQKDTHKRFLTAAFWISAVTATIGGIVAAALAISTPQEGSLRIKLFPAE